MIAYFIVWFAIPALLTGLAGYLLNRALDKAKPVVWVVAAVCCLALAALPLAYAAASDPFGADVARISAVISGGLGFFIGLWLAYFGRGWRRAYAALIGLAFPIALGVIISAAEPSAPATASAEAAALSAVNERIGKLNFYAPEKDACWEVARQGIIQNNTYTLKLLSPFDPDNPRFPTISANGTRESIVAVIFPDGRRVEAHVMDGAVTRCTGATVK